MNRLFVLPKAKIETSTRAHAPDVRTLLYGFFLVWVVALVAALMTVSFADRFPLGHGATIPAYPSPDLKSIVKPLSPCW